MTMTDERAPERDERLLPRSVVAEISAKVEDWVRRIHLHDPHGALSISERGLLHANISMLLDHEAAQAERLATAEGRAAELLAALRADPYFHGVWAWREHLQEGQLGYVRTPEVDRVLRAFAALGAYPATEPTPSRKALTGRADGEE